MTLVPGGGYHYIGCILIHNYFSLEGGKSARLSLCKYKSTTIELDDEEFDPLKAGLKKSLSQMSLLWQQREQTSFGTLFSSQEFGNLWMAIFSVQSECMWPDFIITLNLRLMVGCLLICPKGITHYYWKSRFETEGVNTLHHQYIGQLSHPSKCALENHLISVLNSMSRY